MAKPALHEVPPPAPAPVEGVRAVDRALVLLRAFRDDDGPLPLTELSRRAGLNMTTALRLLGTLEGHGFIKRLPSGGYMLGATLLLLGDVFKRSLRLEHHVMPALERLRAESRESAAFFVREGDQRRCVFRLDSPQIVRDIAHVGEAQPLGRGAHGRSLMALETATRLPVVTRGERLPQIAAIACPVLNAAGEVAGSIGISVPLYRFDAETEALCAPLVMREAIAMTRDLGGDPSPLERLRR
jgi:DNA-binding IclR family transcriptional regulator